MSDAQVNAVSWIAIFTLIGVLAAVGIVDLVLVYRNQAGPTVSSTIWGLAKDYPVIVLAIGILLGHLFWPQHG